MNKFIAATLLAVAVLGVVTSQSANAKLFTRHSYGPEPRYYYGTDRHIDYLSPHWGYFHYNSHIPYSTPVPGLRNNSGTWFRR